MDSSLNSYYSNSYYSIGIRNIIKVNHTCSEDKSLLFNCKKESQQNSYKKCSKTTSHHTETIAQKSGIQKFWSYAIIHPTTSLHTPRIKQFFTSFCQHEEQKHVVRAQQSAHVLYCSCASLRIFLCSFEIEKKEKNYKKKPLIF